MKKADYLKGTGVDEPIVDRSWEEDRRQIYDFDYWENGGIERRKRKDRRKRKNAATVGLLGDSDRK